MGKSSLDLFALSTLSAWWSPAKANESISAEDLWQQIEAGEAPTIVDVRSMAEFRAGHIPGALNIPYKEIAQRSAEIPAGQGGPVVIYCAIGPRAIWAAKSLLEVSDRDPLLLEGHFNRWKKSGLAIES